MKELTIQGPTEVDHEELLRQAAAVQTIGGFGDRQARIVLMR